MAKGSNSAVPGFPTRSEKMDDYDAEMAAETPGSEEYAGPSVHFGEETNGSDEAMGGDYDFEENEDILELPEDAILAAGRSSGTRPLARNLMEELDKVTRPGHAYSDGEYDKGDDAKCSEVTSQVTEQTTGSRPPINGDTPAVNKVLGRTYEEIMEKSTWVQLFEPKRIHQAVWANLSHELVIAVTATTTAEVADNTIQFLKSMGLQAQSRLPQSVLDKWVPGDGEMETQVSLAADSSSSEEEDDDREYPRRDAVLDEYSHQIEQASMPKGENGMPKLELEMHRPLGQIRAFSGHGDKNENPMQLLRGFVYEMKGTRADPEEWCMPFPLSLKDGVLHRYSQLPKKTKRTWGLLSRAFVKNYYAQLGSLLFGQAQRQEHSCEYSSLLSGYARNTGIQFDIGGRKARDHVKWLLETCGDRGLERRLCHIRVNNIHELEDMIVEIDRREKYNERTITDEITKS
ncbi:LOW QUALITY PROTEIN: hypothetical protein PHMEG_0009160 [Phytophthora megakarya]|uniref:Eukaryotic/viral aspartic protease n=1 Tax=Phytophthora megakarya TaxID=4795 RepID=A0A225WHH2_9STRA|nr:LOW QUALITY PROTEIN: hypothetical protein PHMEG_0009160 [Phytophthora megakarya]